MKTSFTILFFAGFIITFSFFGKTKKKAEPVYIEASKQRPGNAEAGYNYLTTGDYLKSGIPFSFFKMGIGKSAEDLGREGINKDIPYSFNAVVAPNGEKIVSPNCLQCHSQEFNGKLVIGMGNSLSDYTTDHSGTARLLEKFLKTGAGNNLKYDAAKNFIQSIEAVSPYLVAETKGVNIADRLAALLVAHRDPKSFRVVRQLTVIHTRRINTHGRATLVVAQKETCHVLQWIWSRRFRQIFDGFQLTNGYGYQRSGRS